MPWTPIAQRFNQLPLILAGPLLRHTTYDEVTVWVALKEASTVTLTIYQEEGNAQLAPLFSDARPTVQLGRHLHVVAVTAHAPPNRPLTPGNLYYYDLQFAGGAILCGGVDERCLRRNVRLGQRPGEEQEKQKQSGQNADFSLPADGPMSTADWVFIDSPLCGCGGGSRWMLL